MENGIDWGTVITITIPSSTVIVGWFLVHWLTGRRELVSRKREARVKALESAYMRLADSSNRREISDEQIDEVEKFVFEIQLYGTLNQIELMKQIVEGFKEPGNAVSYDQILSDLRDTIRTELDLENIEGSVWWFRFNRNKRGS